MFNKTDDKKNGRPVWNNLDKGMFLVFNGKMNFFLGVLISQKTMNKMKL